MEEGVVDCLGTSGLGEFPGSASPVAFSCLLFVLSLELGKPTTWKQVQTKKKKKPQMQVGLSSHRAVNCSSRKLRPESQKPSLILVCSQDAHLEQTMPLLHPDGHCRGESMGRTLLSRHLAARRQWSSLANLWVEFGLSSLD